MEEKDKENKKMKILVVRTFPDILDLCSYNVQEIGLAKALTVKGHQCDVVLYGGRDRSREEIYFFKHEGKEYGFTVYWLKGYSFFKNGFMPSVKKLIEKYDVIQVHEYDQIMSWILYFRPRRPTVIYHGPYYHPYAKGYNFKCKVFDLLFLQRGNYDKIVVLAKSRLAEKFLRSKGFRHVFPVGVGINTGNFSPKGQENKDFTLRSAQNEFRLLYVGKIEERRNVYFLVEIFRKLRQKFPNLYLTIIGDGEKEYKKDFLKSIKGELREQSISYRQKASQSELADIYRASDAFLFTSNYEIFGMVLLEAMYFGLPVASTLNGGSSMLIREGENGFIFKEFDAGQWSEKLSILIEDRDRLQEMGLKARETIEAGFTWEHLAGKFESAYQQAIGLFNGNA